MRNIFLGGTIGVTIMFLVSMTINQGANDKRIGGNDNTGIHLIVPATPTSTVYVEYNKLNYYLKKGYQVQQVVPGYPEKQNHYFLMVKY